LLARLGQLVGVDPAWAARLQAILDNPAVFDIVLAIARFVSSQFATDAAGDQMLAHDDPVTLDIDAQSFTAWLPIVLQILDLLRQLKQQR
jgi:hypothetical protein